MQEPNSPATDTTSAAYGSLLALVEQAGQELAGPRQLEWLAKLDEEYDNLRAALTWSLGEGDDARLELGLRLATSLEPFWERRDLLTDGRNWLTALLGRAAVHTGRGPEASVPARSWAKLLAEATKASARLAYKQGSLSEAQDLYTSSLARFTDLQDRPGIAASLVGLGHIARANNELTEAATHYRRALSLQRELGNKRGTASAIWSLGQVALRLGELREAAGLYDEAIALDRELGDREGQAYDLESAGHVAFLEGRYGEALAFAESAHALYRELGETANVAEVLDTLGLLAMLKGETGRARALLDEAVVLARGLEDGGSALAWPLCRLGILAAEQGELAHAGELLQESLALFQAGEAPVREGIGMCLLGFSALARAQGEAERAAQLAAAAEALYEECDFVSRGYALGELARRKDAVRSALSPESFVGAWAAGRTLTMVEATAYVAETEHL